MQNLAFKRIVNEPLLREIAGDEAEEVLEAVRYVVNGAFVLTTGQVSVEGRMVATVSPDAVQTVLEIGRAYLTTARERGLLSPEHIKRLERKRGIQIFVTPLS